MRNLLLGIALLVLIGVGISGFLLSQNTEKELDAKSLRNQLLTLESYTSEARLLAVQNEDHKVTAAYTKAQAEDVSKLVKQFSQKMEKSSAKQQLEKQKRDAISLSNELYTNLELLQENPENKETSGKLAKKFQQIDDELGKIHKNIIYSSSD